MEAQAYKQRQFQINFRAFATRGSTSALVNSPVRKTPKRRNAPVRSEVEREIYFHIRKSFSSGVPPLPVLTKRVRSIMYSMSSVACMRAMESRPA